MVAMVNVTEEFPRNISHASSEECPNPNQWKNVTDVDDKEYLGEKYNWNPKIQGFILSSFYYGYVLTQMPGGILCDKLGAKAIFGGGICTSCTLYLFIPRAASWGANYVIAIRILQGLAEGITFPAITFAISNWAPKSERTRISSIIGMGMPLGNLFAMPISGVLSSISIFGGWPSTFYLFSKYNGIHLVCVLVPVMYETPDLHPYLSKEEYAYIQRHKDPNAKAKNIPWRDILTSLPMWAVVVAHFGHNYAFLMFLTDLPTYFSRILHFDLKLNGTLSALPYVLQATSALLASCIADRLRSSNRLSVTAIRKLCNSIGLFGPAVCLLAIIMSGCRAIQIVCLFCLALCLNGFAYSGYRATHVDMSPDYSGITFGITNTISNMSGILSPMIVGYITYTGETVANWSIVFYITCAVYIACGLFYAIFASAEVQPWGKVQKDSKVDAIPDRIFFVEDAMGR
ncbi:putative inorganic phosphate cotransporter like protein [Argiope bruennichi]|uniref:Putative inorganic phosphate cotransporter like protein n=1 Tax=Argiope bruennichi TaxID=94029 RepID=A0A8T0F9U4_ARGBR|nr:putative inorganic phosphate cotransporter like protein [Argiope bruennichi]